MFRIGGVIDTTDATRQYYTAQRWAVLYGRHRDLVEKQIRDSLGIQRAEAIGDPDLSVNLLAQVCSWMAVSYIEPPAVYRVDDDHEAAARLAELLNESGVWGLMRRINRDTMALRECLVRVSVDRNDEIAARPAWPQHIRAWPQRDRPDVAAAIWERRTYKIGGKDRECWEVWDITDPANPYARVHLRGGAGDDLGENVTVEAWGEAYEGANYPWRTDDGRPLLPYAWYHATAPDGLWEPFEWDSLYQATLQICKLRSYFVHVIQTASWRQRYVIGLNAVVSMTESGQQLVPMDPSNIVAFVPIDDAANGTAVKVGSFDQPSSPQEIIQAIRVYMHDAVSSTGLPASDMLRTGNDPVSGVSLAISREAQREVQAQYVPTFERGDMALLTLLACAAKQVGHAIPCDRKWRTKHQSLSLSTEERIRRSSYVKDMQGQKLMSRAEAYIFTHPGSTEHEAERKVVELLGDRERAVIRTAEEARAALLGSVGPLLDDGRPYEGIAALRGAVEAEATQVATAIAEEAENGE